MNDVVGEILANPTVQAAGMAVLLAVTALWLAAAWWAYQDASRRTESAAAGFAAAAWIILSTPLTLPLSLAVYSLVRPQATASDSRTERLMAHLNAIASDRPTCPSCDVVVDPEWLRCPWCATWFGAECEACGEWSAAALALCPFCGVDRASVPAGWVAADAAAGVGTLGLAGHGTMAGHETAAAGVPAAAVGATRSPRLSKSRLQRGRMASSWRPSRYASSRASSSASS